jgi:DNA polymerase I-like protein with 3'-5' exonuclease and polymerase domains
MRRTFLEACEALQWGRVRALTIDIETTIVDGSPDPKDGAKGVLYGFRYDGVCKTYDNIVDYLTALKQLLDRIDTDVVLAGHNIKFDLKHLFHRHHGWVTENILEHPRVLGVWDSGIYEYLDSGMSLKYPSLAQALKHHGIEETKHEAVTALFEKGIGADMIDRDILDEYLRQDLHVTDSLWLSQFYSATMKQRALMFVQGWATVAYTRMEDLGMPFKQESLEELGQVLENTADRLENVLRAWIYHALGGKVQLGECKPTNRALSTVLFGVPGIPVKRKELVGKYKNGKPKFKTVEEPVVPDEFPVSPLAVFDLGTEPNPYLGYSTSDDVLDNIISVWGTGSDVGKVCALIKEWRKAQKIVGTYTQPLVAKLKESGTGKVYHSINNVVTNTGRTSSTSPNGQNMPEEIRRCVEVPGHAIIQCDFSQLEMCAAAQLSGDKQLQFDVDHSDVHFETGKDVMGWRTPADMDKASRRTVKGVNFGIIYGGGYKTISKETGVPENLVKKQIAAFKKRYPEFINWQDNLKATVAATPGVSPTFKDGETYYKHPWMSETGRMYMFPDTKRKWDGVIGPNPSAVVNYPVQGFATADIVPLFVALLHGWTRMQTGYPFIAVHDSVAAVKKSGITNADIEREIRTIEKNLPRYIEGVYDVKMNVALKLDIEVKTTWT